MIRHHATLLSLSALLTASLCKAQAAPTLSAHTNVGTFLVRDGAAVVDWRKAGTVVKDRLELSASVSATNNAVAQAQITVSQKTVVVSLVETAVANGSTAASRIAAGTTATSDPKKPAQGPHSFLLRIPAAKGSRGRVFVRYQGTLTGTGSAIASVDVGNDGRIEFLQQVGKQVDKAFPAVAGDRGFEVVLSSNASATAKGVQSSSYRASLVVRFMPQPGCTFTPYGASCNGPVLTGRAIPTPGSPVLFLELRNAPKSSPAGLVFGTRRTATPIVGSSCLLRTNIGAFVPWQTNQKGEARQVFNGLPDPFTFFVQELVLDMSALELSATNGLYADCR